MLKTPLLLIMPIAMVLLANKNKWKIAILATLMIYKQMVKRAENKTIMKI